MTDLVHLLDIHDVHPGDQIIAQGEEATWFGMVLDGKFDILGMTAQKALIEPLFTMSLTEQPSSGEQKDHTNLLPAQEFINLWQSGACDEVAQEKLVY